MINEWGATTYHRSAGSADRRRSCFTTADICFISRGNIAREKGTMFLRVLYTIYKSEIEIKMLNIRWLGFTEQVLTNTPRSLPLNVLNILNTES